MFLSHGPMKASVCVAVSLSAVLAGCGVSNGKDPILGANVTNAVLLPPPGALLPAPDAIAPLTPGLTCPATGPALVSTDPSNGNPSASTSTTGVTPEGKRVSATFSGDVDASGFNTSTFRLAPTGQPALSDTAVVYYTDTKVATLTTSTPLQTNTDYTAVIQIPASSVPGADPGCNYAWTWAFKTAQAPIASPSFVNFGAADTFAIASTAGVANTAATQVNGDAVLNPTDTCNAVPVGADGSFGSCGGAAPLINGTVVTPTFPDTTLAQQVTDDLRAAYLSITPPSGPPAAGSLGGGTTLATTSIGAPTGSAQVAGLNYFVPGVYTSGSTITIADDITLDGQGDADAVFVFQAGSSITATPGAPSPGPRTRILLQNGAKASNVFWQAGASATIGNYAQWNGNVLAGADVTMQTGAASCGRLFAGAFTTGAFVFDNNFVTVPGKFNTPADCF